MFSFARIFFSAVAVSNLAIACVDGAPSVHGLHTRNTMQNESDIYFSHNDSGVYISFESEDDGSDSIFDDSFTVKSTSRSKGRNTTARSFSGGSTNLRGFRSRPSHLSSRSKMSKKNMSDPHRGLQNVASTAKGRMDTGKGRKMAGPNVTSTDSSTRQGMKGSKGSATAGLNITITDSSIGHHTGDKPKEKNQPKGHRFLMNTGKGGLNTGKGGMKVGSNVTSIDSSNRQGKGGGKGSTTSGLNITITDSSTGHRKGDKPKAKKQPKGHRFLMDTGKGATNTGKGGMKVGPNVTSTDSSTRQGKGGGKGSTTADLNITITDKGDRPKAKKRPKGHRFLMNTGKGATNTGKGGMKVGPNVTSTDSFSRQGKGGGKGSTTAGVNVNITDSSTGHRKGDKPKAKKQPKGHRFLMNTGKGATNTGKGGMKLGPNVTSTDSSTRHGKGGGKGSTTADPNITITDKGDKPKAKKQPKGHRFLMNTGKGGSNSGKGGMKVGPNVTSTDSFTRHGKGGGKGSTTAGVNVNITDSSTGHRKGDKPKSKNQPKGHRFLMNTGKGATNTGKGGMKVGPNVTSTDSPTRKGKGGGKGSTTADLNITITDSSTSHRKGDKHKAKKQPKGHRFLMNTGKGATNTGKGGMKVGPNVTSMDSFTRQGKGGGKGSTTAGLNINITDSSTGHRKGDKPKAKKQPKGHRFLMNTGKGATNNGKGGMKVGPNVTSTDSFTRQGKGGGKGSTTAGLNITITDSSTGHHKGDKPKAKKQPKGQRFLMNTGKGGSITGKGGMKVGPNVTSTDSITRHGKGGGKGSTTAGLNITITDSSSGHHKGDKPKAKKQPKGHRFLMEELSEAGTY